MDYLIVDLDQTLIHATHQTFPSSSEKITNVQVDAMIVLQVVVRPYAVEFIRTMKTLFDVYIYTNGGIEYAKKILDQLFVNDDGKPLIPLDHIFSRNEAFMITGLIENVKSLSMLNQHLERQKLMDFLSMQEEEKEEKTLVTLDNALVVDDRFEVWANSDVENLILVPPFEYTFASSDNVLHSLTQRLQKSNGSVKQFLQTRKQVLSNMVISFHSLLTNEDLFPFLVNERQLEYVLTRWYGAQVGFHPNVSTTHIIWSTSEPNIYYPYLAERNNVVPHIAHLTWLLHCIYFGVAHPPFANIQEHKVFTSLSSLSPLEKPDNTSNMSKFFDRMNHARCFCSVKFWSLIDNGAKI